jgi:hypothetical protein
MDKKEAEGLTNDILIADALLQVRALTNLLIAKSVFTNEEFQAEMKSVTRAITKSILKSAKVPGDLDQVIDELEETNIKRQN